MTTQTARRARAQDFSVQESDGRRRRSLDSRARIVEAMLELVREGAVTPGAERVAARADVGLRTVFRHFKDMDSLYGEMSEVVEGQFRTVVERPFTAPIGRERIIELVHRRVEVYEAIAPYKRASESHRHRSPFLAAGQARMVATSRKILQRELPAELADDDLTFEALDLLLSFEAWNRLRREQGLSQARTRETLEAAVRRLLG
ncbi:MAG: TetR/AcrR family transcriptional regulator [Caulobacteraceae bacterium]|nr:TetR/AcrR family transcriptional regulator [Caulobacteraceae bacterium]